MIESAGLVAPESRLVGRDGRLGGARVPVWATEAVDGPWRPNGEPVEAPPASDWTLNIFLEWVRTV